MTTRFLVLCVLAALVVALTACEAEAPAAPVTVTAATAVATVTPEPTRVATVVATPTATPKAVVAATPRPCDRTGRWIDVDVTSFRVRLMEGTAAVQEIGPIAVGREVNTGNYESTQTGCFNVYTKNADMTYDAPYQTYIAYWVGFDAAKDNGFHSFLLDADGKVVDASTGRVSNGCIRSGQAEVIYRYAELGMPVLVHA